jgi:putative hemolysin
MAEEDDRYTFSYATADDSPLKRAVIRIIERMTGQPMLKAMYDDHRANPRSGERFWDAAIRYLKLNVVCDDEKLSGWPKTGPLVVVSNHPFGVLDGVVICHVVSKVRPDFLILTNAVLLRAEEMRSVLLPIDFAETEEALKTNLQTRKTAQKHVENGGCLIVFPAGGVSTTPKVWKKRAVDADWKTFTAKIISQAKAPVGPVYFEGQNSRLFQVASHISMTLRLSLLFKEVSNKIGSTIRVRVGDVTPYDKLPETKDRHAFMRILRQMSYALGGRDE